MMIQNMIRNMIRSGLFLLVALVGFQSSAQGLTLQQLRGHSLLTAEREMMTACQQAPLSKRASPILQDLQVKINLSQCQRATDLKEELNFLYSEHFARDLILRYGRPQLATALMREALKSSGRIQWLMFSDIRRLIESTLNSPQLSFEERNQILELRRRTELAQDEVKQSMLKAEQRAANFKNVEIQLPSETAVLSTSSSPSGAQ
jgi:hypothetical protein